MTRRTPVEPRGGLGTQALMAFVLGYSPVAVAQSAVPAQSGTTNAATQAPPAPAPVPVTGAGRTVAGQPPAPGAPAVRTGRPAATGGSAGGAPLSDEASVARAVLHFDSGRYLECAAQFEVLLDLSSPRRIRELELVERARVYRAACLIGLGKVDEADRELRSAIRNNPQMGAPDALAFPQAVIDRFLRVREGLMDEIRREEQERVDKAQADAQKVAERVQARKQRTEELEYLASQEIIVRQNSRWIAALPFGVGQFQNGQDAWGWFFLGSEILLGGTVVGAMVADSVLRAKRDAEPATGGEVYDVQTAVYSLFVGASYGFLGVAALGIAQAELVFVPEIREVRNRPLPPHLRRTPPAVLSVAPWILPRGLGLGAVGNF